MPQDIEPTIRIALAVEENRTVYVLIYRGETLGSFSTVTEAIAASVKLERETKQQEAR
jgi:hypothetical protein